MMGSFRSSCSEGGSLAVVGRDQASSEDEGGSGWKRTHGGSSGDDDYICNRESVGT
jgi:hypothetical protein